MEKIHIEANEYMFVSKSIGNIEVVVQPGTVQGFTKHKTLCYTGDNGGEDMELSGDGKECREKGRGHNKRKRRRRIAEKQPFMGD